MTPELKKIECDSTCGFMVRSHDEKELVEIATQHVKKAHNMNVPEKDMKAKIKKA
jgi:predicted small metal-binding protein